jgi:hypothetical protein
VVEGASFVIANQWPHAETSRATADDAEKEHHAVEVSWTEDGEERIQWVYQTESGQTASELETVGAKVRVTAPGVRPAKADDESFQSQVQFLWKGRHYDLPEAGGEVFEGWTIKSFKTYQHALMDGKEGVEEAEDASFTNRVLEVHLTSAQGSEERHLAFLDHPAITKGIHPTILPVSRISGNEASLSRLVVCAKVEPAAESHFVHVSPVLDGGGLTVRVWPKGGGDPQVIAIREFPAELTLGDGKTLTIERHFSHARPHVRWERREAPEDGEAKPALLIEHRTGHHQKLEFVLVRGEVTPCRIGDRHLMLRYGREEK